ncbi:unnamed protein product [Caenorhabditis angaria]|uniref:L-Fucosyltransferase n=1 Tax=Caenorhabditis angaria TaxID=860376 RepID=A0A9P1IGX6_9PELO|nr:unnamed protein product [Caenorhabditis angaria]
MYFNRFILLLTTLITASLVFDKKYTERTDVNGQTTIISSLENTKIEKKVEESEKLYDENKFIASKLATTARLANHIFELVSIYGIARKLRRAPQIYVLDKKYEKLIEGMQKVMPGLINEFEIKHEKIVPKTAKNIEFNVKCCVFEDLGILRKNENASLIYSTGHFYQSYKYFDEFREEVLEMVAEKKDFGKLPVDGTKICIHIRRGDFLDGQHHSTQTNFTLAAYNFILETEKPTDPKIIIMGDDLKYEQSLFPKNSSNVFISNLSPSDDLIYAKYHCDITLITAPSSTFGWWISYFSKSQKVYYQDIRVTNDVNFKKGELEPLDFYPPNWNSLILTRSGGIQKT